MKKDQRPLALSLFLAAAVLLLSGCGSDGTHYVSTSQYAVYHGYHYGPGYGYYYRPPYYHDPDDRPHRPGKPPGRPPGGPDGPVTIQPVPKPRPRPPANIGRPRPRPMPRRRGR